MAWAGNRLIVGNDGGLWSSVDDANTWADHNTTLAITQFYHGCVHPTNPNFALGGSQDNGTEKWTGTDAWTLVFGGDGAESAISSGRPDTDWAVSFQDLNVWRTTDGGASFSPATFGIQDVNTPFIARLKKCPNSDDVFIAGGGRDLWKSIDFFGSATPSWDSQRRLSRAGIRADLRSGLCWLRLHLQHLRLWHRGGSGHLHCQCGEQLGC